MLRALWLAANSVASMAADLGGPPVGVVDLTVHGGDERVVPWVSGTVTRTWLAPVEDLPGNGPITRANRVRGAA